MRRHLFFTLRTISCCLPLVMGIMPVGCTKKKTVEAQPASYVGVGVELTMETAGARITRVLPNSSAEAANLKPEDLILDVAGQSLRGQSLVDTVELLRGEPGTDVTIFVRSKEGNRYVNVVRRKLKN